jgi:hypothetical protein
MHTLKVDFGNGVVAGTGTAVGILDYDGLDSLPTRARVVEHAIHDGGYVASTRAATRRLTFDLDFGDTLGWADVGRLFPSGGVLDLVIERDGIVRRIRAVRDSRLVPLGGRGVLDPVAFQIPLLAADPYLKGEEHLLATAASGGLEYPVEYATEITMDEFESGVAGAPFLAVNGGDHAIGFLLNFVTVTPGDLTITSGGQTMTVGELTEGERLVIDMARQTISIDGVNGFARLAAGSFIRVLPGPFDIMLDGAVGLATITFTPVFEGV